MTAPVRLSLDVQFLPDVDIPCPECRGSRYAKEASLIKYTNKKGQKVSLPELMDMDIHTALEACDDVKLVKQRLTVLKELGLGYLTLGEETPSLSGGEAQRLKLASEMGKLQNDSLFIFDEPTIVFILWMYRRFLRYSRPLWKTVQPLWSSNMILM